MTEAELKNKIVESTEAIRASYKKAEIRIHNSNTLRKYKSILLNDLNKGKEYFDWIASTTEQDIMGLLRFVGCGSFKSSKDANSRVKRDAFRK